jgi:hypothetical protein
MYKNGTGTRNNPALEEFFSSLFLFPPLSLSFELPFLVEYIHNIIGGVSPDPELIRRK